MADETRIIRIVIDSSKAVDGSAAATRALANLEKSQAQVATSLDRMEQSLGKVGGYLKAQLALMIADVASRLLSMAKGALDAAANMDELAEQVGLTARGLQAMQFAAVQSNVKLEQLEGGLGKFAQKMGEAAEGSKEMIEALDRLGVKNLDAAGKLRSTETLMTEVAAAILKIEDPARRSAAMVDFFGKTGAKMLPMLKEMAGGFDDMAGKAKAAGAMISAEAIAKLDKLGDASERNQLKLRALFAENAAGPLTDVLDFITKKMENLSAIVRSLSLDFGSLLKIAAGFANPGQLIGQLLAKTPAEKLSSDLADARRRSTEAWDDLGSPKTSDRERPSLMSAYAQAQQQIAALERQQGVMAVGGRADYRASDPDGIGVSIASRGGAGTTAIKGAGQSEIDAIAKLRRDTGRELADANDQAAASERGARAVAELEVHYKALKAAQDAYGKTADQNKGQVAALTSEIEKMLTATERAKNLKDFNLGTEDLEKANVLMEAENRLINANAEDRAREIALIRLKQDVERKGLDENDPKEKAAIERRKESLITGERLKAQGAELQKANELWTEPLKTALNSIQTTAADAFAGMLESGKFSFQALGDAAKKIVIRMIAEFAALAVIRPMLGSLMGGLQGLGLVSGSTAASLGYGSGAGGSSIGMPSFGGGSAFGFLNQPIANSFGRSIDSEIANWSTYGSASQNSLNGGFLGGTTWGQGLGAAAGIGMGAYQLATSKSTAGTIGGIGSMVGAGMSLIPGMQIPGMAISMLSAILPSLFGGEEYKWAPLAGSSINFNPGAGGYTTSNSSQNGGSSLQGQFGGIAGGINALYAATGGTLNPALATGGAIWNNQREGTTSTYAIHPTQGSVQLSQGSGDQSAAIDAMIAKIFYMTATTPGALNGVSPSLTTALGNHEPTTTAQIQELLKLIDTYDSLTDETSDAEKALKEIDASFESMTAGANQYGLSLAPIQAKQKEVTERYANDFIDGMLDPLAVSLRALDDQRTAAINSAEYIKEHFSNVFVDINRITDYFLQQETKLREQAYGGAIASLEDAIKRLTFGDLSNTSPTTALSGIRAGYTATLAQAQAGSADAISRLAGEGVQYAAASRSYYGSSTQYQSDLEEIRRNLADVQAALSAPSSSGSPIGTAAAAEQAALVAQLAEVTRDQSNQIEDLKDMVTGLVSQLRSIASNRVM